jgi:peptide/nickel transport system permease protein
MAGSTLASPIASARPAPSLRRKHVSPWGEAWRRFRRHRLAVASSILLLAMILAVALGPLLWHVPINEIDFDARLSGPTWAHPLGTDDLGQDLLARMLYGGRISLAVGLTAMLVAVVVGTTVGALAGISRGSIDALLMWVTDLFLSLPQLPVLLLVIYFFREGLKDIAGPELGTFFLIVVVIGGFRWMPVARLVRAQFFSLREKEFVEAARALGASTWRQVVRHILPNALSSRARSTSPRRSSPSRPCPSSASAFRPTFRPGVGSSTTPRTISTLRRTGRSSPGRRSSSRC